MNSVMISMSPVHASMFPSVFFFQAEDGIRATSVTGVQTCALPISRDDHATRASEHQATEAARAARGVGGMLGCPGRVIVASTPTDQFDRRTVAVGPQIGRASCRERVWRSVVSGSPQRR